MDGKRRYTCVLVLCLSALVLAALSQGCATKSNSGGGGGTGDDDSGSDCDSTAAADCISGYQSAWSSCINACFGMEDCPGYLCAADCEIALYDGIANCESANGCPDAAKAGCELGCWATYHGCIYPDCAAYDQCVATRDSCAEACFTGS